MEENKTEATDAEERKKPSKRPWHLSAIEVMSPEAKTSNDVPKTMWLTSVVDDNGLLVCYGETENMKLIVEAANNFKNQ